MEKQLNQRWLVTLLLCFFLGTLGIHRFYTGNKNTAIAMLLISLLGGLVFGLGWLVSAVWALVDLIRIIIGQFTDGQGQVITMKV